MSSSSDSRPARLMDESEVRSILQRAAEFDAANYGKMTEAQLIDIAKEAGISGGSVQRALQEAQVHGSAKKSSFPWWTRPVAAAVGGVSIALAYQIGVVDAAYVIPVLVGSVLLVLALRPAKKHSQLAFHLGNLAAWGGLFLPGYLSQFSGDSDGPRLLIAITLSSVIGGAIVAFRSGRSGTTPGASAGAPSAGAHQKKSTPWWKRWYSSIDDLFSRVVAQRGTSGKQKHPQPAPVLNS